MRNFGKSQLSVRCFRNILALFCARLPRYHFRLLCSRFYVTMGAFLRVVPLGRLLTLLLPFSVPPASQDCSRIRHELCKVPAGMAGDGAFPSRERNARCYKSARWSFCFIIWWEKVWAFSTSSDIFAPCYPWQPFLFHILFHNVWFVPFFLYHILEHIVSCSAVSWSQRRTKWNNS